MKFFSTLLLAGALFAPVGIMKADEHDKAKRYYDKQRHDYHEWNEQEEHSYQRYLQEQKRQNHAWAKASRREQADYWKWRHEHPDAR